MAVRAASIHTVGGIVLLFIGVAIMTRFLGGQRSAVSWRPTIQRRPRGRVL